MAAHEIFLKKIYFKSFNTEKYFKSKKSKIYSILNKQFKIQSESVFNVFISFAPSIFELFLSEYENMKFEGDISGLKTGL